MRPNIVFVLAVLAAGLAIAPVPAHAGGHRNGECPLPPQFDRQHHRWVSSCVARRTVRYDRRPAYYHGNGGNGTGNSYRVTGSASPTGLPYEAPNRTVIEEGGIRYTGLSCNRKEGTIGREGYGPDGQIGCWKF